MFKLAILCILVHMVSARYVLIKLGGGRQILHNHAKSNHGSSSSSSSSSSSCSSSEESEGNDKKHFLLDLDWSKLKRGPM